MTWLLMKSLSVGQMFEGELPSRPSRSFPIGERSLIVRQDHCRPSHSTRSRLTRKSGHTSPTSSSGILLLLTEKLSASLFLQRPWVPRSWFSFGERALPPQEVLSLEKMDAPTCVVLEHQLHPSG